MKLNKLFRVFIFLSCHAILVENKLENFKSGVLEILQGFYGELSADGKSELGENFITAIELSVEFYKIALDLNNQADVILGHNKNEALDKAIDNYLVLNEGINELARTTIKELQSEGGNDPLVRLTTINSLAQKISLALYQLNTLRNELMLQWTEYINQKLKDKTSVEKMKESIQKLNDIVHEMEKSGLIIKTDHEAQIDEDTLGSIGPIVLKFGSLFLLFWKEAQRIDDKLQDPGYFNTTMTAHQDVLTNFEDEHKISIKLRETVLNLLKDVKGLLGADTLWSYAKATRRLIVEIKLPKLQEQVSVHTRDSFLLRVGEAMKSTSIILKDVERVSNILTKRVQQEMASYKL